MMVVSKGRIILVGGEKGGIGKIIIVMNLVVLCVMMGCDVVLIDIDLQGSVSGWCLM